MPSPLYFFPALRLADLVTQTGFSRAALERYDLAGTLGDVRLGDLSRQELTTAAGPGGKSGAMIAVNAAGQPPARFGYHAAFQSWTCVLTDPELWVGVDREYPPTPVDLARPNLLDGHPVTLADGNSYVVPIVRSPDRSRQSLPKEMFYDAAGQFQTEVHRDYAALWEISGEVWDFLMPDPEDAEHGMKEMAYSKILDYCLAILGANYRYNRAEHAALRLVNTGRQTWERIFEAALDAPFIASVVTASKKNADLPPPATAAGPPGGEGSAPSTDQAAENST